MKTITDRFLPLAFAPLRQLGMQVAFGLEGLPSNRMIMCYGPPGGGKSTLLYQLSAEYENNSDEVWIVDTERAIDKIYLASYFTSPDTLDYKLEALKYFLKASVKLLKDDAKSSDEDTSMSEEQRRIVERRVEMIPILCKELEDPPAVSALETRTVAALLRTAIAEYRIRNIKFLNPLTMEEFEREIAKMLEAKKEDPERRHKRVLIGVDSINYLLTEDVLERAVSSEGSNFNAAKYLHTLLPKLITKLAGTETTIFFIHQQTTTIKMNPWEQKSVIDDVATKGGSAAKFGATIMVGVKRGSKKLPSVDGGDVDTGTIEIAKAKLRGGSKGNLKGRFYLKESLVRSVMDFNEPFLTQILAEEEFGIRKHRGAYFVPEELLANHPEHEAVVKPNLRPFPKEEEGKEGKLYFQGSEKEIMDALLKSPAFTERCLGDYGILPAI
jgi:RecA/RadA recombinase